MVIIMAQTVKQTSAKTVDDVFGYIVNVKKTLVNKGDFTGYRYSFLVKSLKPKDANVPAQFYNDVATTVKACAYLDTFKKGDRVGINLTDNVNFNDIKNIHHAGRSQSK